MKQFLPLTFLAVVLLAGCSKPGPAVSLVNVGFKDMTALETTATFTLRFSNDQPDAMDLSGGAHRIYINGLYVGKGLSDAALAIPRLGTATQEVTVHLSNLALATRFKPVIESRSFEYRIRSTLYGKSGGRFVSENSGRLDLKDFTPTSEVEKEKTAPETPKENPPTATEPPAGNSETVTNEPRL